YCFGHAPAADVGVQSLHRAREIDRNNVGPGLRHAIKCIVSHDLEVASDPGNHPAQDEPIHYAEGAIGDDDKRAGRRDRLPRLAVQHQVELETLDGILPEKLGGPSPFRTPVIEPLDMALAG